MTASWLGTGSVGFSVPSMNPVRSRSWRYGQLEVSSASEATSESSAIAARDVEDHVVGAARQSENCVVLRGRHDEAVAAGNVLVEAGQVRRRVVRKRLAPGLGPDAGDEIDAAHRRPRLAQRGDRSHQTCRRPSLRSIELEVRVCSGPEGEDAALWTMSSGLRLLYAKRRTNAWVASATPRQLGRLCAVDAPATCNGHACGAGRTLQAYARSAAGSDRSRAWPLAISS